MAQQMVGGRPRPSRSTSAKALRIAKWVAIGIAGACVVVVVFAVVFGLLVQWLWNAVVVDVLGVKQITYWQALGLTILARLLVGGFELGHGGSYGSSRKDRKTAGGAGEVAAPPAPPAPYLGDYERYWQVEGRAAFAAYMQRQEQARQQAGPDQANPGGDS